MTSGLPVEINQSVNNNTDYNTDLFLSSITKKLLKKINITINKIILTWILLILFESHFEFIYGIDGWLTNFESIDFIT